jgi:hypothetical protein
VSGFRESPAERTRIASLDRLLPIGDSILEIGARDGYITKRLADRYHRVIALDLQRPSLTVPNVTCVQGDVRSLQWANDAFDVVLCSEVLEHISPNDLATACNELARVTKRHLLIGVPFEQDIRLARTVCGNCGAVNGPYGHVNRFDERRLRSLFDSLRELAHEKVGTTRERTTWLSDLLMRRAGYPWGTYEQEEACIACGEAIGPAPTRSFAAKLLSAIAIRIDGFARVIHAPRAKWLHVLFTKELGSGGQ